MLSVKCIGWCLSFSEGIFSFCYWCCVIFMFLVFSPFLKKLSENRYIPLPQTVLVYVWICLPGSERCIRSCIPYIFLFSRVQYIAKSDYGFAMSFRPSVRRHETTRLQLDGFSWNLNTIRRTVQKIHFSLKSDKNNGYFTWRPIYIFDYTSLTSS